MAFLKKLRAVDLQEIAKLASSRDEIDTPEEISLADMAGPGATQWRIASEEIVERIDMLSEEARAELIAVMWLGRGDSGDDFPALVTQAMQSSDSGDSRYLSSKAVLYKYVKKGAEKVGLAI